MKNDDEKQPERILPPGSPDFLYKLPPENQLEIEPTTATESLEEAFHAWAEYGQRWRKHAGHCDRVIAKYREFASADAVSSAEGDEDFVLETMGGE